MAGDGLNLGIRQVSPGGRIRVETRVMKHDKPAVAGFVDIHFDHVDVFILRSLQRRNGIFNVPAANPAMGYYFGETVYSIHNDIPNFSGIGWSGSKAGYTSYGVRLSNPWSVIRMVCSNWAEREPSFVTAVH